METPQLLLPGHVVDEFTDGVQHDIGVAKKFNELLRELDERLVVFWVKEGATSFPSPGRWHIAWVHPHTPELNTYWCVCSEDGGYSVPSEGDVEKLRSMDTWSGQHTYEVITAARTRKQAAKTKLIAEKRAEFREKLTERLAFMYDPKVVVTGPMKDQMAKAPAKTLVLPGS